MPFNSSQNNFNSSYDTNESFRELQNSYTLSKEGFDHIPNPNLIYRPASTVKQYILPANTHSSVSYYDQDELKYLNGDRVKPKREINEELEELEGAGVGKMFRRAKHGVTKAANVTSHVTKSAANASEKATRGTRRAVVKSIVDKDGILHHGIEKVNDYVIPMAFEAAGTAAGAYLGNPALGAMAGKATGNMARSQLHQKTGYGSVAKTKTGGGLGVGEYKENVKLDKILSKYAPNYHENRRYVDNKQYIKPIDINKRAPNKRNIIVKQVMHEQNLNLPQASKYVKDNNLY